MPNFDFMDKPFTVEDFLKHLKEDADVLFQTEVSGKLTGEEAASFQYYVSAIDNISTGLKIGPGTSTRGNYNAAIANLKEDQPEQNAKSIAAVQDPLVKGILMLDNGLSALGKGVKVPTVKNIGDEKFAQLYLAYLKRLNDKFNNLTFAWFIKAILNAAGFLKSAPKTIKTWGDTLEARIQTFKNSQTKEQEKASSDTPSAVENSLKTNTLQSDLSAALNVNDAAAIAPPVNKITPIAPIEKLLSKEHQNKIAQGIKYIDDFFDAAAAQEKSKRENTGVRAWFTSLFSATSTATDNDVVQAELEQLRDLKEMFLKMNNLTAQSDLTSEILKIKELYIKAIFSKNLGAGEYNPKLKDAYNIGNEAFEMVLNDILQNIQRDFDLVLRKGTLTNEALLLELQPIQKKLSDLKKAMVGNGSLDDTYFMAINKSLINIDKKADALTHAMTQHIAKNAKNMVQIEFMAEFSTNLKATPISPIGRLFTIEQKASFAQKVARKNELSFLQKVIDVANNHPAIPHNTQNIQVILGALEYFNRILKVSKMTIGVGKFKGMLIEIEKNSVFANLDKEDALKAFKKFVEQYPNEFKDMAYTAKITHPPSQTEQLMFSPLIHSRQQRRDKENVNPQALDKPKPPPLRPRG